MSSLFPSANLNVGGFEIDSHLLFVLITTLAVLPTIWLRDLTVLSYISGKSNSQEKVNKVKSCSIESNIHEIKSLCWKYFIFSVFVFKSEMKG